MVSGHPLADNATLPLMQAATQKSLMRALQVLFKLPHQDCDLPVWLQIVTLGGWMPVLHAQSWQHLSKIVVLAITFLLSVVLNNMALRYIPVSFVEVMAYFHSKLSYYSWLVGRPPLRTHLGSLVSQCFYGDTSCNV